MINFLTLLCDYFAYKVHVENHAVELKQKSRDVLSKFTILFHSCPGDMRARAAVCIRLDPSMSGIV